MTTLRDIEAQIARTDDFATRVSAALARGDAEEATALAEAYAEELGLVRARPAA